MSSEPLPPPEKKKRAKPPNYTQKTLAELRGQGALAAVVEKWVSIPKNLNPAGGVRRDMFGLFDIVAIRDGTIVGIQSTSRAGKADHVAKMFANENLAPWIQAGGIAELWLWFKDKSGARVRYTLDIQAIRLR